jgi:hypothetical protein
VIHRALVAKGFAPRMEIQPGYWTVLKTATSKPNAEDQGGRPTARRPQAAIPFG